MAHFAELNENNVVVRVVEINDSDTSDAYGVKKEYIGIAHCEKLLGGRWIETFKNGEHRDKFAGISDIYVEEVDAFLPEKPFPSWILDTEQKVWRAPLPLPINVPDDKIVDGNGNIVAKREDLKNAKPYQIQLENLMGLYAWDETIQNWIISNPEPAEEMN